MAIVDLLDEGADRVAGLLEVAIAAVVDFLLLERLHEALRLGVVTGIADAAHGEHPQEPGFGVPSGGHSRDDPALRHAAAGPALHRPHQRQETCRVGRTEEGRRHRGPQCLGTTEVVKIVGMAGSRVKGPVIETNGFR